MSGAAIVAALGGNTFTANASPTTLSGFKSGTGIIYTSGPSAVTVQGGQVPYTYLWTHVSGSILVLPQSSTSFSTRFYANFAAAGSYTAVYKCVVTDDNATAIDSENVTITLTST